MDYAHTYPNATIRYHVSDMCLHIDSDVDTCQLRDIVLLHWGKYVRNP